MHHLKSFILFVEKHPFRNWIYISIFLNLWMYKWGSVYNIYADGWEKAGIENLFVNDGNVWQISIESCTNGLAVKIRYSHTCSFVCSLISMSFSFYPPFHKLNILLVPLWPETVRLRNIDIIHFVSLSAANFISNIDMEVCVIRIKTIHKMVYRP